MFVVAVYNSVTSNMAYIEHCTLIEEIVLLQLYWLLFKSSKGDS